MSRPQHLTILGVPSQLRLRAQYFSLFQKSAGEMWSQHEIAKSFEDMPRNEKH